MIVGYEPFKKRKESCTNYHAKFHDPREFSPCQHHNRSIETTHRKLSKREGYMNFVRCYSCNWCSRHACKMWKHKMTRELFHKNHSKKCRLNRCHDCRTRNGIVEKDLETFKQMQLSGVNLNSTTFSDILLCSDGSFGTTLGYSRIFNRTCM